MYSVTRSSEVIGFTAPSASQESERRMDRSYCARVSSDNRRGFRLTNQSTWRCVLVPRLHVARDSDQRGCTWGSERTARRACRSDQQRWWRRRGASINTDVTVLHGFTADGFRKSVNLTFGRLPEPSAWSDCEPLLVNLHGIFLGDARHHF